MNLSAVRSSVQPSIHGFFWPSHLTPDSPLMLCHESLFQQFARNASHSFWKKPLCQDAHASHTLGMLNVGLLPEDALGRTLSRPLPTDIPVRTPIVAIAKPDCLVAVSYCAERPVRARWHPFPEKPTTRPLGSSALKVDLAPSLTAL